MEAARRSADRAEAREIADRLELLAQRLEVLHRLVVAPRLEALIALERRAAALAERYFQVLSQRGSRPGARPTTEQ